MRFQIGCVVEGHGDAQSVPILIRRILGEIHRGADTRVAEPIRLSKQKLVKDGQLERATELAARKARFCFELAESHKR